MAKVVFNKTSVAKYLGIKSSEIVGIIPDNSDVATVILRDSFYKEKKE
jgi:hypothetical protein